MGKLGNFELNAEQRRLIEIKNKRREELRAQFLKEISNPHRHATGEGGALFDPALQRFQAMRASYSEYFKPNAATFRWGMILIVIPIVGTALLFKHERQGREKKYRNGEVSYRAREFKFV